MSKAITTLLAFSLLVLVAAPEQAAAEYGKKRSCYTTELVSPFPGAQPVTGWSRLCVTRRGINASLIGTNLTPGEAYTVWWIYFDDPTQCVGGPAPGICGEADFGGEKPLAVLTRMDGAVAPRNGRKWFTDYLRNFKPSKGSQIWLVLQRHGPVAEGGERRARQLLTHEDFALGGAPHLTNSVDGQLGFPNSLAVFQLD
ncbi:MAG: hypothetical protein AAGE85_00280 [Pseudomonadota bacterium]